jgi:hypothetical protein
MIGRPRALTLLFQKAGENLLKESFQRYSLVQIYAMIQTRFVGLCDTFNKLLI